MVIKHYFNFFKSTLQFFRNPATELSDRSLQNYTGHPESGPVNYTQPSVGSLSRNGGISVLGSPPPPTATTTKSLFNSMKKRNRSINFLVNVPAAFSSNNTTTPSGDGNCSNNSQHSNDRFLLLDIP